MKKQKDFNLATSVLTMSSLLGLIGFIFCRQAQAIVPVSGWGYSIGYGADRLLGIIEEDDDLWNFWIDPPPETILSGRVSLFYDPDLFTIVDYGWVGEFGEDPSIASPPVTSSGIIPTLNPNGQPWALQSPNDVLQNANVDINDVLGQIVIDFDWGESGFQPQVDQHFNFFGIVVSVPDTLATFKFVPRGTGDFGLLGSPQDVEAVGTNASTFLECSGGFCGEEPLGDLEAAYVPEPLTILGTATALGFVASFKRKLKSSKSSEKETTKVS